VTLEMWFAFAVAASIILVIPGPTILLVIGQAVAHGRRSVFPLATGVLLGDFTAMTLSLLGLGALLSASAALFSLFKWIGSIYLICLGIKLWRIDPGRESVANTTSDASKRSLFKSAYIVTALNPKGIAFFVAFLPQFVNPSEPVFFQLFLLGSTFLLLAVVNAALYAVFAGQLGEQMKKGRVRRWFNRCGGTALIGAGIFTAGMQRST